MRALFVSTLIVIFGMVVSECRAATLTIVGDSDLRIVRDDTKYRMQGTYSIENKGDETAKEVFPYFRIGTWTWSGEAKSLDAGAKAEWTVDGSITEDQLRCSKGDSCADLDLPLRGMFPLLILRHYQDLNGYRYSAPDIRRVAIGDLSAEELARLQAPSVETRIRGEGNGETFQTELTLLNLASTPFEVAVSPHSTREIQVLSQAEAKVLGPNTTEYLSFDWKNFSGLEGSGYAAFAIVQWNDGGLRNTTHGGTVLKLSRVSPVNYYLWGGVATAVLFGLLFLLVSRRSRS